ncbi:GOLPH3/VPS74 family protein [Pseudonocardia abyssalis]|uniref:GPP34 family phosphoprotein n=1 Tax=Pseudonocardia abyssalis TaxID=2792008 RepID=A0ABS6UKW2_9PSEU|nr:GPP34 family phosphoprotein [Pseudonocardia abyssalis]MBW0132867.1 GPP34 family phosphoprotein [Pseudonocardia abyssalis]
MGDLTLDEELFLISRDPESGRDRSTVGIDVPLAGAVLISLAVAAAITLQDGRVVPHKYASLPRAHLQDALALLAESDRPRKPSHWLNRLPRKLSLQETIGVGLAERGIVRDERVSFLGVTVRRFPDVGPEPRSSLEGLVAAALTGREPDPDPRTRLLAGLLGPADLVKKLVERSERRDARKRATAFTEETPLGGEVAEVVAAAQ